MAVNSIQILVVVIIIIIFGVMITLLNMRKKDKTSAGIEQSTWQKIEVLNTKKKELVDKKKELSYKYTAKTVTDSEYSTTIKYLNDEIEKVNQDINSEVNNLTQAQGKVDAESDVRFTNIKIKSELSETNLENKNLKEKVSELEEFIKNVSKNNNLQTNNEDTFIKKYYEIILNKYKDEINETEKKTISEIKEMVKPTDLTIKSLASKYQPISYDFNKDYLNTLRQLYNYLKSDVDVIRNDLKLLFWIDFTSIITNKIADEQDISILFCSCMKALSDEEARIEIVMLDDEKIHAFVKTKYKNTFYIFDLAQKVPFDMFKNVDEKQLYQEYNFNNSKIAKRIYAYNQNDYIDFRTE